MTVRILKSIEDIDAAAWNSLQLDGNPFLRHEFLAALEHAGCIRPVNGWTPCHLLLADTGLVQGAMPLYLKEHSWGEFVFDWSWANAYARAGLDYYPKLVSAIPFTPAVGPRLLHASGTDVAQVRRRLVSALRQLCRDVRASSAHVLFPSAADHTDLQDQGFLMRKDCQFHWHNRGYHSFDEFLATFRADKRKKANRERRRIQEAGISFDTLTGADMTDELWRTVYELSARTFRQHGHEHYLTVDVFLYLSRTMPLSIMVKLARHGGNIVGAAIFFEGGSTLYGRYWGAMEDFHSLHFETCYYQGIDYCIRKGLARFEPGTQGEHKVPRGFEPAMTWSAHDIVDPRFRHAIAEHLQRERDAVDRYADEVRQHVPFHRAAPGPAGRPESEVES